VDASAQILVPCLFRKWHFDKNNSLSTDYAVTVVQWPLDNLSFLIRVELIKENVIYAKVIQRNKMAPIGS
jgi:hypothetical protein